MINDEMKEIFNISKSKTDVSKKLNIGLRNVNKLIEKYDIDISHFDRGASKRVIYEKIKKICPVCKKEFEDKKDHKREKITCSHACSNTYFRTGWSIGRDEATYRAICFHFHKRKCVICEENKIVEVHHYDENKNNNEPENLIPLCPTHHRYWHSRYKYLIVELVNEYRNKFINL